MVGEKLYPKLFKENVIYSITLVKSVSNRVLENHSKEYLNELYSSQ